MAATLDFFYQEKIGRGECPGFLLVPQGEKKKRRNANAEKRKSEVTRLYEIIREKRQGKKA